MILEGFEIENWSCIKRVFVADLPTTGVAVLHGPNGTGKSSIIEALRACLMDNKSTSKALDRGFSKNSSAKPRVSVTFRAEGTTWRITKQFNSKESKLESRTPAGQWKLETVDPSEAHERTRKLTGGSDSSEGLHQLLWLTQAEIHLPDPKKFDPGVQSRLKAVLGVLQTPLDDRFLDRVKEEWSKWFGVRSKPGEKPKLKKDCPLDKAQVALEQHRRELAETEDAYKVFEKMIQKSGDLEILSRDFRRQIEGKKSTRDLLQKEYEESLKRLESHRLAAELMTSAKTKLHDTHATRQRREDGEKLIREANQLAEKAGQDAEEKSSRLRGAEKTLRDRKDELQKLGNTRRGLQTRLNQVNDHRQFLTLNDQLKNARQSLKSSEEMAGEIEDLKMQERDRPAPDAAILKKLESNRYDAAQLRADLEAAAITLTLSPEPGASAPRLSIDGDSEAQARNPTDEVPIRYSIRRRAEIAIGGWGRAEIIRGSDSRSLNQIEDELADLDRLFAEELAPFGVAASDLSAIDQLRDLAAAKTMRDPELKRKQKDLARLAPDGLDFLRQEAARLEKLYQASQSELDSQSGHTPLHLDAAELERLAGPLKTEIELSDAEIGRLEEEIKRLELGIDGNPEAESESKKTAKADKRRGVTVGLRQQEAAAKYQFTSLNAAAEVHRQALERVPTAEQISLAVQTAEKAVVEAQKILDSAKLSESEETIGERRDAADEGLRALSGQLAETEKDFNQIKGALRQSEGLHQKRATAAARVEEYTERTNRDSLHSEAFDRLYALFEECREKQLGAVMGPIHDRVLRWMRLLRIGSYQSIGFNDQLLPEKLIASGGAIELTLRDESAGTIEQIALMVRLALGSTLSTPTEPVVAILDDPLTHSDVVRLDLMRAVLRSAAGGDIGSMPPAGPMQIVVFTCHPEWFAIDGARVIDLRWTPFFGQKKAIP